ncbi:5-oxopent-3-ene-1,2,5-tricarboxylate decarboxylase [Caballeronia arationis]|jgi:2-keto-4-pentenoate hydratase/2-oxohepta-3-ene-1,7-dioic acid hydratase in catechol pathway|uniref:2-keto-4-pentenoate hydratase/2-oxohepta-3-ene-1,7-dioic acid hydratase (Catechol pathway) n=1 Tax=Caballeronia arationis TaxID=1777142 RepID=A0A7Z7IFY9_9BURK|nr:fumarylacetoacetate hydrolase family protein [Caballeronia arationis]SAK65705.1 5-oxopent-3-ene-1,2,5-tricarboxylate decarboxylase [Caballeronia arationis]SOE89167.1 2-keto-4-pentenoate hydratase/2-oxohepta-3-ene-1,7-dioic acid hydratase (catechol pathway) [Caballeronia arationis]
MKLASFNGGRIGVVIEDDIVDVSELVNVTPGTWPPVGMLHVIDRFASLRGKLDDFAQTAPRIRLADVRLETPVAWPNKVIAFPANYHAHVEEMKRGTGLISPFKADGQGFFLKANSSLSGPADPIVLPQIPNRQIHHECELAIIIGKGGREISRDDALTHVFGYACLIDVVVRGKEERVMRKSYDTFCPVGPYIVTADEVPDYDAIDLKLSVNGEVRQHASTRDLIVDIPEMIRMASAVMTLYPGDIIATGTPAGVGPINGGDKVVIEIAKVGSMSIDVVQSEGGGHPVWDKPLN